MKIVEFSLRKRVTISMIVMVIIILGFVSFTKLGLDMLPDLEYPYITVFSTYSGVSSEDIEQNLTRPIEQWVSTVSRVKDVRSISLEGQCIVMVEFLWGTNLDYAAQDIRDTIGLYEQYLPKGATKPVVMKFNFSQMPVMGYGITGDEKNLSKLKEYIDNEVGTQIERIDGVASCPVFSPEQAEILVSVDKGKLESRGLPITQVELAIQTSNINLPAGYLTESHKEYLIRAIGEYQQVNQISNTVIGMSQTGSPVYLRDIAAVTEAAKETRLLLRLNGRNGIMMMVTKSSGANSVLVARAVKKLLTRLESNLKGNVRFHVFFDMSRIIEIMATKSTTNIWQGGLLAMLLILLFLRNWKPTVAIGVAIPLSIIVTFIAFYLMGYTLNMITLGGLALGVGMLVDNAVVVIENIFRHLEEGKKPFEAARIGTSQVGTAIAASTLTTVAVFFPMIFASGIAGKLSQGLAVSVIISLMASLFVSLTILPILAAWMFTVKGKKKAGSEELVSLGEDKFAKYRNFYERLLRTSLSRRKWMLIGVLAVFVLSLVVAVLFMGTEFMPVTDTAMIYLKVSLPVGSNFKESDRIIHYLENQSLKDKEVITTFVQVGTSEQNASDTASGINPTGSHEASIYAYLTPSGFRKETDRQMLERWRQYFPELENGKITAIDMASASMFGSTSGGPIEIKVFGRDLYRLEGIAERIKKKITSVQGIRDIRISMEKSKPEIQLHINKEEASKLGLTSYDISHQIQTYTIGTVVSRSVFEGEDRDIRVRLDEKDRASADDLLRLPIMTPQGKKVFLSQLIEVKNALGPLRIDRQNQTRRVSVNANFVGRDLGSIVKDIQGKVAGLSRSLPGGYFIEYGGDYQNMMETFTTMAMALLLSLVLVFAVMASLYENLLFPFINMFTIPLAFIGVVFLMLVTGTPIGLPSIMGFIILGGIAVNNGIVMVDYVNQLVAEGMDRFEAVIKGAITRLRPILITSLTTIAGMLPMAMTRTKGGEMNSPMAIALMGGLLASTFLTLFIIPILYTYFAKIKVSPGKQ